MEGGDPVTFPRRSPFPRSTTPLRRSALARGTNQLQAKPLPPAELARRRAVREEVFARDGGCRLAGVEGAGRCFGQPMTFHHRRKASQGGAYTVANGACLCSGHNDQLEADADLAALGVVLGLVIRA